MFINNKKIVKSEKKILMKFAWRHNLIYPLQLLLWSFLRKIFTIIFNKLFHFQKSFIFTLLMFSGEFFAGLILYVYQSSFLKNKRCCKSKELLIYKEKELKRPDSYFKIILIIFVLSYSDFIEFILANKYIPKYHKASGSLGIRLVGIMTISSALLCNYLLKFPIFRHQFFSRLIIGICFIIIIISEFFFQDINIFLTYGEFGFTFLLIIVGHFFNSILDSGEKYVVEYNFIDYFLVLSLEGFFGILITIGYSFIYSSFNQLTKIYSEYSGNDFAIIIILFVVYLILCGGRNAFRVVTNKLYSPMTKSLTDYFLNPIYLIYNYIDGDFVSNGKRNIFYFLINIILSFILSLCGIVYNEIIILFFFGLESETHDQIASRSSKFYKTEQSEEMVQFEDKENDLGNENDIEE